MAAVITDTGGGNLLYTGSAVNNVLKISQSTTNTVFNDTGETITNSFGSGSGGGTNTVTIPTAGITSIAVDLGTGTNTLNLQYVPVPLTYSPSSALGTVNVGSAAPTVTSGDLSGILDSLTVNSLTTGGTLSLAPCAAGASVTLGATAATGLIGPTQNKTLTYTTTGGNVVATFRGNASAVTGETWAVSAPVLTATVALSDGPDAVNVRGTAGGKALTVSSTGATVAKTLVAGTAAGSAAGMDAVLTTGTGWTVTGGGVAGNSVRFDDSGSATGSKSHTITPSTTQAVAGTATGYGGGSGVVRWNCNTGGTYSGGLRFDFSAVGAVAVTVATNPFLDNATLAFGGTGNTLDLTACSITSGSGGVYTQANGKTVTVTGTVTVSGVPAAGGGDRIIATGRSPLARLLRRGR